MTDAEKTELRAALMQLEKALETERACVIRVRHIVERSITPPPSERKVVTISEDDSLAGMTSN